MVVESVTTEPGAILVRDGGSRTTALPVSDLIRGEDLAAVTPVMTATEQYTAVPSLTTLANWFEILLKTLRDGGVISDQLYLTWDLETILKSLRDDFNTDIGET